MAILIILGPPKVNYVLSGPAGKVNTFIQRKLLGRYEVSEIKMYVIL